MSNISERTNVYMWTYHPPYGGQRVWVSGTESLRNKLGELVLKPLLDDDPRAAASFRYDIGVIMKRRFESENVVSNLYQFRFSLSPTGEEIAGGNTTSAPTSGNRVIMQYRGILARPGRDVRIGPCWFVKFPGQQIESVRGNSPEGVVNKVYERKLQHLAEQAPPEPEPVALPVPTKPNDGRMRPGSFK